jgi:hypothetical protein
MFQITPDTLSRKTPTRRDDPVKCATCSCVVPRASRRQRFCSAACRKRAFAENADRAIIFKGPHQGTGQATNSPKKVYDIKALQADKTGSRIRINGPRRVVERELISDREWRETTSSDGVRVQVTRLERRRP